MASVPLSQGFGYGIVLGLGFAFALGMILTTFVLKRYNNEVQTSEMFSTAGRTVKSGLVASAVVSSWTWAATLLQSSGVAYRYGVSGPFWYASGATVQILLFATLAIQLKRRAPNAHTFLEVIRARYGVYGHVTYIGECPRRTMPCQLANYESSVWADDEHPGHRHAFDWRLCRGDFFDWRSDACSLLSAANRRRFVHDLRRHQGHLFD